MSAKNSVPATATLRVGLPTHPQDVANKQYVDTHGGGGGVPSATGHVIIGSTSHRYFTASVSPNAGDFYDALISMGHILTGAILNSKVITKCKILSVSATSSTTKNANRLVRFTIHINGVNQKYAELDIEPNNHNSSIFNPDQELIIDQNGYLKFSFGGFDAVAQIITISIAYEYELDIEIIPPGQKVAKAGQNGGPGLAAGQEPSRTVWSQISGIFKKSKK